MGNEGFLGKFCAAGPAMTVEYGAILDIPNV